MPPGDDQPPTAPSALTATTIGTDSVTLRWQPSADNVYVAWYEVLRVNPDGSTTPVATAPQHPPTGPTARVGALQPQTAYTFVVRAHDDAGNTSPPTEPLTVRTQPPVGRRTGRPGPAGHHRRQHDVEQPDPGRRQRTARFRGQVLGEQPAADDLPAQRRALRVLGLTLVEDALVTAAC